MSIRLVQWEDSTVTPTNDRIIYDNGYNGIIEGCAITSLGLNMLHIGDGYVRILGGLIEIVGQDIEVETSASGNKKGQLWIRLDLGSSTPVEFMTEAAATLSTLTQNAKANYENGVYEFQLCTYDISETTISNLAITAESAPSIKALFNDVVTAANESETSSTTPRDSDLLDGHPASYFATNDSLNSLVLKIKTRVTFDSNGQATITNSKITSNSVALAQRRTRYTPSDIVLHCECYDGGVGVVAYRANSGTKYAEALDISVIVII